MTTFFNILVFLTVFSIIYFYIKSRFVLPIRLVNGLISALNKSDVTFIKQIELYNAHKEIKELHNRIIDLVEIVRQREISRNSAEKNLRHNEIKYREMAEFLPQCIFEADEDHNLTYVNKAFQNTFGYYTEEVRKGIQLKDILDPIDIEKIYSDDYSIEKECKAKRKNGDVFDIIIFVSRIVKSNKRLGVRAIVINDTDRKKQLEDLLNARQRAEESDKLKSAFLSNMSHEIRTPMNAIIGFSSLLSKKRFLDESGKEYLHYIMSSGEHLLKLIDDIIDLARIEAGDLKLDIKEIKLNLLFTDLRLKSENIKKNLNKKIEIIFNTTHSKNEFYLNTDLERLSQVLLNLIGNAVKYTNSGYVEFGYEIQGKDVLFYVKDTGPGIPVHMHEAIFNRFHHIDYVKSFGKGLGLTLTKNLVQILGGRIWLQSQEGKGTTFFFTVPANNVMKKHSKESLAEACV